MLDLFARTMLIAARAPYEIRPVETAEELRSEDRRSLRGRHHAPMRSSSDLPTWRRRY